MKKWIPLLVFSLLVTLQAEAARGRKPCSGAKGGIAHCTTDGRFVCNDGSLSQSKKFCSGYGSSDVSNQAKPSTSTRKTPPKKIATSTNQPQTVVQQEEQNDLPPRKPTCAPLYMASQPGYTHLPICTGNQY